MSSVSGDDGGGDVGVASVVRSFRFKLDPTASQVVVLERLLGVQRELYNAALEERREAWRRGRVRRSRIDQFKELAGAMAALPELAEFGLQAARGTLWRLDRAFAGFFRRVGAGQRPGYPRFQGAARFDSVSYPEPVGRKLIPGPGRNGRLRVHAIGHLKIRLHRPLEGEARTLTLRRHGGRWWAIIQCRNIPARRLAPTGRHTGVDRGVAVLAACADGTLHANPRHLAATADRLAAAQHALAKTRRRPSSKRRQRAKAEVGRLHRRVRDQRKDRLHKLSHHRVGGSPIRNMVASAAATIDAAGVNVAAKAGLNRSILDAGWGQLANMTVYKAEEAGRRVIFVNPTNTSRTCSSCGHLHAQDRIGQDRWHCCACGQDINADVNAAINIATRAGLARHDITNAPPAPATT